MTNTDHFRQPACLEGLGVPERRRLLVEHLTKRKRGLYWESDAIARN